MFFFKKKSDKKKQKGKQKGRYTIGEAEVIGKVHTIPSKFLQGESEGPKKPRYLLFAVIGITFVIALGGGTIFLLNSILTPEGENPVSLQNEQPSEINANEPINAPKDNQIIKTEVKNREQKVIGTATMIIPDGAVEPGINVDIVGFVPERELKDPQGYNLSQVVGGAYSFTPDGLSFQKGVTLILSYTEEEREELDYEENDLKIAFGQEMDNWEILGQSSVDNNQKTVSITLKDLISQGKYGIVSLNALKNSAANENTNHSLGQNDNANTNTNTSSPSNVSEGGSLPSSTDSDADGLTDVEEDLYATAANHPDTDTDGFLDGDEVKNLYSPTAAKETLEKSESIASYTNTDFRYSVLYPKKWVGKGTGEGGEKAYFTSATGEFVQVIVESNPSGLTAKEWYAKQNSDINSASLQEVQVNDLEGVESVDGRTIYLAKNTFIYTISYSVGLKEEMNFYTTFRMMVKSFKLSQGAESSSENSNANMNSSSGSSTDGNKNSKTNTGNP